MSGLTYTVHVAGVELDSRRVLLPLSITHGRSKIGSQPDAPTLQFSWLGEDPPGDAGDLVVVTAALDDEGPVWVYDAPDNYTYDSSDYVWDNAWSLDVGRRFTGHMNKPVAHEQVGSVVSWDITCVGEQARLATLNVLLDRPAETDVARVQAIAANAGFAITIDGPAGVVLAADSIDQGAIDALHQVCESSGGLVWQDRAGVMHYGTAEHRRVQPQSVLSADCIIDGLTWQLDVADIINHVTAKWGPEGAEEESTHQDDLSVTMPWGKRHADVQTICAAQADAEQMALLVLARRAWPFWMMDDIIVYGPAASRPDALTVVGLEVSSLLLLPAPAAPDSTPGPWVAWAVEGWTEDVDADGMQMQLAVSDGARWVETRLRTWGEAATVTWADELAGGSWLDALIWEAVP